MFTIYIVKCGDAVINSFTTQQFLTEEAALSEARAARDAYNTSDYGKLHPSRIVRGQRLDRARPL